MNYSTSVTESGIVKCNVFSDTFKTNCVTFNFFWPLSKKDASFTSLLAAVLKRGNTVIGEMDKISSYLDLNYGANFDISTAKIGEMQELSFVVTYVDDKYALDNEKISTNMIKLLESALFCPITEGGAFKKSFVEQEKQNLKDRINALINDKQVYSFEKCKQTMFKNEKYGIYELGDLQEIDAITPESLYDFYKEIIDNAMLIVNYGGSFCDCDALLSQVISKLDKKQRISFTTEYGVIPETVNEVVEPMNVAQSKLNMGFRLGKAATQDLFALKMFNVIFGASPTSKLFMNVRERLSLCYYCSSVADSLKNVMFVYSGVETKNADVAKKEILNQLSLMKKGDFTKEEFDNAMAYLIDSYIQAGDSALALSSLMTGAYINGHRLTPQEQIKQIRMVTPERIKKVAADIVLDTVYLLKGMGGAAND